MRGRVNSVKMVFSAPRAISHRSIRNACAVQSAPYRPSLSAESPPWRSSASSRSSFSRPPSQRPHRPRPRRRASWRCHPERSRVTPLACKWRRSLDCARDDTGEQRRDHFSRWQTPVACFVGRGARIDRRTQRTGMDFATLCSQIAAELETNARLNGSERSEDADGYVWTIAERRRQTHASGSTGIAVALLSADKVVHERVFAAGPRNVKTRRSGVISNISPATSANAGIKKDRAGCGSSFEFGGSYCGMLRCWPGAIWAPVRWFTAMIASTGAWTSPPGGGTLIGDVPEAVARLHGDPDQGHGLGGMELGRGEGRQGDHQAEACDRDQRHQGETFSRRSAHLACTP